MSQFVCVACGARNADTGSLEHKDDCRGWAAWDALSDLALNDVDAHVGLTADQASLARLSASMRDMLDGFLVRKEPGGEEYDNDR